MNYYGTNCPHEQDGQCGGLIIDEEHPGCPHTCNDKTVTCEFRVGDDGEPTYLVTVNKSAIVDATYSISEGEDNTAEEKPRKELSNQDFLDDIQRRHQRRNRR